MAGLLPLWLLLAVPHTTSPRRQAETLISMRLLPLPAIRRPPAAARPRPRLPRTLERQSASPDAVALTAPISAPAAASATEPVAVVATAASSPASAPLNLRISKALLAGTRSEVGKMADASGAFTGDAPKGLDHQLKQGVASSAKMDCLGPNEGGSIFSVVVIAVQAARGKCAGQ